MLEEMINKYENTSIESEKKRLAVNMERTSYYIKGLEDAKKYLGGDK